MISKLALLSWLPEVHARGTSTQAYFEDVVMTNKLPLPKVRLV